MTMHNVLSVTALCKYFGGVRALDGLDMQIRRGEILGLVGPNGAGKTALINTITGFYRATSGRVELNGDEITGLPLHLIGRLGVGRTFQNIRLFKRMSVLENVMVARKSHATNLFRSILRSGSSRVEQDEAMRWLDLLKLGDKANQSAASLSYGDARRLEIARALAGRPKLLLLDEPAAGMNESETGQLIDDIQVLRQEVDAILLVEHDMHLIRKLSDRLVAMDYGKKIAEGRPAEVLAHPEVLKAYLGTEE
ncbi:ABC transporter ATP-binding protein [Variovorax sp. ZT4R33]|uniref:ABC transporter ATP-binding protein n=1 Tax=Variovorax sp. ZT4R33 TaxID=3443743 RepID=UPI003F448CCF